MVGTDALQASSRLRMIRILSISCLFVALHGLAWCSPIRDSLAMFESGATGPEASAADRVRGGAGEISRFEIRSVTSSMGRMNLPTGTPASG